MKSITGNNLTLTVGNVVKYKYRNGGFFVFLLIQIFDSKRSKFLVLYDEARFYREEPGTIVSGNLNNFTRENTEIIV